MCLKLLCLSMAVEGSIARLPNIWRQFLINTFSCSLTTYLHPNYGIDEEEDTHEETHIGQRLSEEMSLRISCDHFRTCLERLDKGVEENSDADTSSKQFDESRRPKQFEKTDLDQLGHVDDASHNCDEVKDVPRLAEIVLKENSITLPHH